MLNKKYIFGVTLLTFILPALFSYTECLIEKSNYTFEIIAKWFIFFAVGFRLSIAGIKQIINPKFTAKEIFQLDGKDSFPILRELGFANFCFGLIALISLFIPQWRIVSTFGSGLYYGLAGALHLSKKETNRNEQFAMITDFIICVFLIVYFVKRI